MLLCESFCCCFLGVLLSSVELVKCILCRVYVWRLTQPVKNPPLLLHPLNSFAHLDLVKFCRVQARIMTWSVYNLPDSVYWFLSGSRFWAITLLCDQGYPNREMYLLVHFCSLSLHWTAAYEISFWKLLMLNTALLVFSQIGRPGSTVMAGSFLWTTWTGPRRGRGLLDPRRHRAWPGPTPFSRWSNSTAGESCQKCELVQQSVSWFLFPAPKNIQN